jgi:hypothetical protein
MCGPWWNCAACVRRAAERGAIRLGPRSRRQSALDKINQIGYMPQRRVRGGGRPSLSSSRTGGRRAQGSGATKAATKDVYGGFTPDDGGTFASPARRQAFAPGPSRGVSKREPASLPFASKRHAHPPRRQQEARRSHRHCLLETCARKSNIVVSHEGTKAQRVCAEPQALSRSRRRAGREQDRQPAALRRGGFLLRAFVPSCENFRRGPRGETLRQPAESNNLTRTASGSAHCRRDR